MENKVIKVLVVDDSRIYRETIKRILEAFPDVEVVGVCCNGVGAIEFLQSNELPDLVTLDVEMPEMDGLETLGQINRLVSAGKLKAMPLVLMISTLTCAGAKSTISAIQNGAFDFITKPAAENSSDNERLLSTEINTRLEMIRKKVMGGCHETCMSIGNAAPKQASRQVEVRSAIAVGCSSGGAKSVFALLPNLCRLVEVPVFLTANLPNEFLHSMIDKLNPLCSGKVKIAENNEPVEPGRVYLAPADKHLIVRKMAGQVLVGLTDAPPENNARPSFGVLLRSMNMVYGGGFFAVFLAGCGVDGSSCITRLKRSGVYILAQNHADCGICEMPGAAISTGGVDKIIASEEMPQLIRTILGNS